MFPFLDRSRSVAGPGYNRWLVPPAALCIHLSIGQAYAWSVFNIPLTRVLGITQSAPGDWSRESLFETGIPALIHAPVLPRFVF